MLSLGMLGMWHTHAEGIVRQVAEHPDEFRLSAFNEADPAVLADRRKRWEPLLGKLHIVDSSETLVKMPLDGIVVEGRVHDNLRLARLAMEGGKPVMLEKPAGDNLDAYRRLIDLAQRKH